MSFFFPPQAFFDCSFPHQLRTSCHNYETKSVYLYVSIKDFDGVTAQNVKMGKGDFIPFSTPFFGYFRYMFWFVILVVFVVVGLVGFMCGLDFFFGCLVVLGI